MKALRRVPVGCGSSACARAGGSSMPIKNPPASAAPPRSKARRERSALATKGGSGLRSMLDPLADTHIRAAAAKIAGHRSVDRGIVGLRVRSEQGGCGHDLPGLAIAALDHLELEPGLLDLRACGSFPDALDGCDSAAADRADRQLAGAHRGAVEMQRACPALGNAAAELGAGQAEHVSHD